jgi:hypothetical protein
MTKPTAHTTIRQKRKKIKNNVSRPHSNNIHQLYNSTDDSSLIMISYRFQIDIALSHDVQSHLCMNYFQVLAQLLVKPVVVFGSETWAMTTMHINRLSKWDRKILRI